MQTFDSLRTIILRAVIVTQKNSESKEDRLWIMRHFMRLFFFSSSDASFVLSFIICAGLRSWCTIVTGLNSVWFYPTAMLLFQPLFTCDIWGNGFSNLIEVHSGTWNPCSDKHLVAGNGCLCSHLVVWENDTSGEIDLIFPVKSHNLDYKQSELRNTSAFC